MYKQEEVQLHSSKQTFYSIFEVTEDICVKEFWILVLTAENIGINILYKEKTNEPL